MCSLHGHRIGQSENGGRKAFSFGGRRVGEGIAMEFTIKTQGSKKCFDMLWRVTSASSHSGAKKKIRRMVATSKGLEPYSA